MRVQSLLSAVVLFQMLNACGGNDDSDSRKETKIESSVQGEKQLNKLSADEHTTLCREIIATEATAIAATVHSSCGSAAEDAESENEGTCQKTLDNCIAHPSKEVGHKFKSTDQEIIVATPAEDCDDMVPSNCSATVDELVRCFNYDLTIENDYYESFTCDGDEPDEETIPADCKAFATKCPDYFSDRS
jgi:hypothetical protein